MRWPNALALWGIGLLLISLTGCSSAPAPRVKITYSDIVPEAPVTSGEESPSEMTPAAVPEDGSLPALGAPISTKEAMEKGLAWATEGLRSYERSEYDAAHKSLTDARIILLEADLPDFLEEQGLAALRSGLPEDLRRYDIEAIAKELEKTDRLSTAEQIERAFVDREVRRILWQFGDTSPDPKDLDVLIHETHNYIGFFRGRYRDFFERAFLRKHKYWPTIQEVLTAKKIPPDLGYVALVESGFSPRAVSHADAHGVWQFIPETGRRYGLMNGDDLRDVRKSTIAAADYLLDLISIFGSRSFLLATAAYNAGEGRIMKCLRTIDDLPESQLLADPRLPCPGDAGVRAADHGRRGDRSRPEALRLRPADRRGDAAALRRDHRAAGHLPGPPGRARRRRPRRSEAGQHRESAAATSRAGTACGAASSKPARS
jgi:soluble lytic murein transglycosylase-like protein